MFLSFLRTVQLIHKSKICINSKHNCDKEEKRVSVSVYPILSFFFIPQIPFFGMNICYFFKRKMNEKSLTEKWNQQSKRKRSVEGIAMKTRKVWCWREERVKGREKERQIEGKRRWARCSCQRNSALFLLMIISQAPWHTEGGWSVVVNSSDGASQCVVTRHVHRSNYRPTTRIAFLTNEFLLYEQ